MALFFAAEVDPTSGRWFMAPDDFVAFRKLKATDGRYIVEPDVTQQGAYRLLSMPVTVTNKLTAGTTLLVSMPHVAVARDLAPSVKTLDELYADTGQIGIRAVCRYDLGLIHPDAVVLLTTP